MSQHKATPKQWAEMEQWAGSYGTCSCLLELRDRIEALENAAKHSVEAPQMVPALAPAGLVERVAQAIADDDAPVDLWLTDARAAILAVAEWLEEHKFLTGACWLREEVERG